MPSRVLVRKATTPTPPAPPTATWTQQSLTADANEPDVTTFTSMQHDPVNERLIAYLIAADQSLIYATGLFDYDTAANDWTRYGGTDNTGAAATSALQPHPGARHPVCQIATDTARGGLWIYNGVFQGDDRGDLWFFDYATHTYEEVAMSVVPTVTRDGLLVYVPGIDVLMLFGQRTPTGFWETWILGLTDGTLSADQLAAGCVDPMVWKELTPTGMPSSAYPYFINGGYDPAIEKVIITGGFTYVAGSGQSEGIKKLWEYSVPGKSFSERAVTGLPTEVLGQTPEQYLTRISSGTWEGQWLYHRTAHRGDTTGASTHLYDPITATMIELTNVGTGPQRILMGFQWDPWANKAVGLGYSPTNPRFQVWQLALS